MAALPGYRYNHVAICPAAWKGAMELTREWWHGSVAYQIYPKSFMDSNGDGIGDLRGIIGKLDYLSDLGINLLWLSPAYPSPLADEGYDISDYYGVNPLFGTLADMDELIAEGKKRGIRLILDLVVNHCSDEHAWFQEALRNPESPYRDFFYLADSKPDGTAPTNWRSYFGGSAWEPFGDTGKMYLHLFHKKQPDLNWENPALRAEVRRNVEWWLDRGVAGFRVDAILNIKKALPFRDYPADGPDGLCDPGLMLAEAKGIGAFLGELKDKVFAPRHAFTVGEVFNISPERLGEWIGPDGYFSSIFDFSGASFRGDLPWHKRPKISAEDYKACIMDAQEAAGLAFFYSNIIENHDEPRGVNYYLPEGEITDAGKKMLAGLYFLLRGVPFIYQGQELGMENALLNTMEEVRDCATINCYHVALEEGLSEEEAMDGIRFLSRDNARTPVQWDDTANAGFSTGDPWIGVNPNYGKINAATQIGDPESVLSFYKRLITLRKDPEHIDTWVYGKTVPYRREQENLIAYRRVGQKTFLVLGNLQGDPQDMPLPAGAWSVLLSNMAVAEWLKGNIRLEAFQLVVLESVENSLWRLPKSQE